jgi:hypothetical protein
VVADPLFERRVMTDLRQRRPRRKKTSATEHLWPTTPGDLIGPVGVSARHLRIT